MNDALTIIISQLYQDNIPTCLSTADTIRRQDGYTTYSFNFESEGNIKSAYRWAKSVSETESGAYIKLFRVGFESNDDVEISGWFDDAEYFIGIIQPEHEDVPLELRKFLYEMKMASDPDLVMDAKITLEMWGKHPDIFAKFLQNIFNSIINYPKQLENYL